MAKTVLPFNRSGGMAGAITVIKSKALPDSVSLSIIIFL